MNCTNDPPKQQGAVTSQLIAPEANSRPLCDTTQILIAAEFTGSKRALEEATMRIICDALAVKQSTWMVNDSVYDALD
jgi:hypothetical protein